MAVFRGFCRVLRGALVALVSCFASVVSFAATINLDNNNNTPVSVQLTSNSNGVYRNGVQMTPVDPFVSGGDNPLSVLPINNGSHYFAGYYNVVQQSDQYAAPIGVQYINSYGELTLAGNTAGTGYNNDATWVAEYLTQKSAIKLDSSDADPAGHGSEFVYMNGSYNGSNGENVYLNAQYSNGNLVYGQLMTVGSNHIIVPSKNGRAFAGYYSEANGQGVKCLNYLGEITSDGLTVECSAAHKVWYAYWCPEGQAINEQTGECGCPTGYTETTGSSLELGEPTGDYYAYGQDGGESGDSDIIKDLLDENTNRSNVFGIVFSGGNNSLFGQAMCSHVPSNLGYSGLYSDLSNSSGDNCWCNLTGYSLDNDTIQSLQSDSWFFAEEISNDCEKYCADTCAKALSGSAGGGEELREAMLGSNYCVANQYEVRYYCDGDDSGEPDSEPVTTDTVYYNQSGYSFDFANNSLVAGCGQTGHHVDSYKCYNINTGLQVNDADVNPWHIASDVYCIPTWAPNVHSVNYNCNNGGLGTNSSAQNSFGTTVNIPQTAGSCVAPQGTDFNGWICSGVTMSSNNTFTMPDNDVTCTAQWTPVYTMTYQCGEITDGGTTYTGQYTTSASNNHVDAVELGTGYVLRNGASVCRLTGFGFDSWDCKRDDNDAVVTQEDIVGGWNIPSGITCTAVWNRCTNPTFPNYDSSTGLCYFECPNPPDPACSVPHSNSCRYRETRVTQNDMTAYYSLTPYCETIFSCNPGYELDVFYHDNLPTGTETVSAVYGINLNNSTFGQSSTSDLMAGQFAVDYTNTGTLYGSAVCSDAVGYMNNNNYHDHVKTYAELQAAGIGTSTSNYCWCKADKFKWENGDEIVSDSDRYLYGRLMYGSFNQCSSACAQRCAEQVGDASITPYLLKEAAYCKPVQYTITYNGGNAGGQSVTSVAMGTQSVSYGATDVALNTNTYEANGYAFVGWSCETDTSNTSVSVSYNDDTGVYAIDSMPADNVTCTAQWGEIYHIHYMTTYSYQNGDQEGLVWSPGLMPGTYISGVGENIGALTHSNPNRVFLGWCVGTTEYVSDCNDYANYVNGYQIPTTQTGDLRMYAKWQYNLTFDENAPSNDITVTGMPAVNPVNLTYRDTYILPELSADDYEFIGWSCKQDDNNSTVSGIILGNGDIQITMPAADVTCTAQWASTTVYLDWSLNGGSWAQDENENTLSNQPLCVYGANTMGPVYKPVRTGYNFTGWTVTGHTDSPPGGGGT